MKEAVSADSSVSGSGSAGGSGGGSAAGPAGGPRAQEPTAAGCTALTAFTGNALPYGGGHPFADYRRGEPPFAGLTDLAGRWLGGAVIAAADESSGARANLLLPGPAAFDPDSPGDGGRAVDGWRTRRRRGDSAQTPHPDPADHDWALVRLGAPGVIRGLVVDTAHFRADHPHAVSVEATAHSMAAAPGDLLDPEVEWTALVPRTQIGGHAENAFAVHVPRRFTHVRLRQYPDGGIARLRVYGEVVPDPGWLAELDTFDLVALENGGSVQDSSDGGHAAPAYTILPGRSARADDGRRTRRRRDGGHDWITYRLAGQGVIRAVEIDTANFHGDAPGWASLSVRDGDGDGEGGTEGTGGEWVPLVPRVPLQPDTVHRFLVNQVPATHVRLDIFPDGGIARLRLHGSLTARGAAQLAARTAALS